MWRTVLVTVLCSGGVLSYNLQLAGNEKQADASLDLVLREPVPSDLSEEGVEVREIYYRTVPKSDPIVPYYDERTADFGRKFDSSEEDRSIEDEEPTFQPWSILWYVGSFGGLIAFFLVVSCSEWCCRSRTTESPRNSTCPTPSPSEAPPPAYDLFAPPTYESLCTSGEKTDYDVYVVPVHAIGSIAEDGVLQRPPDTEASAPPPAYFESSVNLRREQVVVNVGRLEEEHRERRKVQREIATQT